MSQEESEIGEICVGLITDPLYLPLKRGGSVCPNIEVLGVLLSICTISSLKESKKFGGVGEKIYLCIRLTASQQLKRASLRSTCTIFAYHLASLSKMNVNPLYTRLQSICKSYG